MSSIKRITNLTEYQSVLPYSSEMFGVYQSLIGWKSKRVKDRIKSSLNINTDSNIDQLVKFFDGAENVSFNEDCFGEFSILEPGTFRGPQLIPQSDLILNIILDRLKIKPGMLPDVQMWKEVLDYNNLLVALRKDVLPQVNEISQNYCKQIDKLVQQHGETEDDFIKRKQKLKTEKRVEFKQILKRESAIAGMLAYMASNGMFDTLQDLFFTNLKGNAKEKFFETLNDATKEIMDPFLTFDPKSDIQNVTLSPVGIVHLFRQYFFELDTFLGSPTGHVWIAPGSTVELIEVSTRKSTTEKTYESSYESIIKSEKSATEQDEISEAVKQDNRDDLKLGVTTTVNQSWGSGNVTSTATLNKDKTQQTAREHTHKKMREQTQKLSAEIRENFKSTFKTITEITDTSSKRHVLSNNSNEMVNYELRRKMRQVAVQVQDVGTYLCWQTFVDEPGDDLGLANLVHIAKPADLVQPPPITHTPYPQDIINSFNIGVVWDFGDERPQNTPGLQFIHCATHQLETPPEGYVLDTSKYTNRYIDINYISHSGEDSQNQIYGFKGQFNSDYTAILIGPTAGAKWDKRIDFVVGGTLYYVPTQEAKDAVNAANEGKKKAADQIVSQNTQAESMAYLNSAKERIEFASNIKKRKYEDLREEERIVVYRSLISSLMLKHDSHIVQNSQIRHVFSELINALFDVDKMLYFVAPEWWKPMKKAKQSIGLNELLQLKTKGTVNWSDSKIRLDDYLITEKSEPAPMGSSLGWIIQLDGDNLRNAFLNAPWVKAVIPIRPGKEEAAMNWLQNAKVEGAEGLDADYIAPQEELDEIRAGLLKEDANDIVATHDKITLSDAIRYLCKQVSQKHTEGKIPVAATTEINDDNSVKATPIDKVYEYGFYPLVGGFKFDPTVDNNGNPNYQVFDQWLEILPTDQIVPVEVKYDPKTGRQI